MLEYLVYSEISSVNFYYSFELFEYLFTVLMYSTHLHEHTNLAFHVEKLLGQSRPVGEKLSLYLHS